MITIIDYGLGNLTSIKNMLKKCGNLDSVISSEVDILLKAEKLILPGVGHYDYGMTQLKKSGLVDILNQRVLEEKIPILGICLGAQLLTEGSEEGKQAGLGWIKGFTRRFRHEQMKETLPIPHMGWSDTKPLKESVIFRSMPSDARFYYVHSYHIHCTNSFDALAQAEYGYSFTAAVENASIYGVQFHPEKSHRFGLQLLKNFIEFA